MARLDALPSIDIIRGFKGILDFYLWKGLPCVRAWPAWRPARQTDASKAAALLFGAVIKAFSLTHGPVLDQLQLEATGTPRTPRDIYVSGVYGNLHEASMSDFLDLLTECRDFLSNLTALLNALDSIDTDELVVNVDQSVLPPAAATDAHQLTQITALQKLDDLQDALQSKGLDRLIVRGEDQLFNIKQILATKRTGTVSGAGGHFDSPPCPDGVYWAISTVSATDVTSPTTYHVYHNRHNLTNVLFHLKEQAFVASAPSTWTGLVLLDYQDVIRVDFGGSLAGDTCTVEICGYEITAE